jgi:thymidine kinase
MYSGKTKKLIHIARILKETGKNVLIAKPLIDSRYSYEKVIATNDRDETPAIVVDHSDPEQLLSAVAANPDILQEIIIDEIHFFHPKRVKKVIAKLLSDGYNITVAGLDRDYLRRPFGATLDLFDHADEKWALTAVCEKCGGKAVYSERVSGSTTLIDVGEKDKYIVVCKKCHVLYKEQGAKKKYKDKN